MNAYCRHGYVGSGENKVSIKQIYVLGQSTPKWAILRLPGQAKEIKGENHVAHSVRTEVLVFSFSVKGTL